MNEKEIVAICYDFDGTLIAGNMQEVSFIPTVTKTEEGSKGFWREVKEIAKKNDMDEVLAYMHLMVKKASSEEVKLNKEKLREHGADLKFFNGVEQWFGLINGQYNKTGSAINIQHFIISSGIDEMIRGSKIGGKFKHIFASGFLYDENGVPAFAARSINYTTKVQYLFRINKGIPNSWENEKINRYSPVSERPVPFPRMIYIGDGETDVPAMKMVNSKGGYSIAVYPHRSKKRITKKEVEKKKRAKALVRDNRAHFAIEADYSREKELHKTVTSLIDRIRNEVERKMNLNASGWDIVNPEKPKSSKKTKIKTMPHPNLPTPKK